MSGVHNGGERLNGIDRVDSSPGEKSFHGRRCSSPKRVRDALSNVDPLWDELFPAEQARIVRLLVERVEVGPDGADIRLRTAGLTSLVRELGAAERIGLQVAA